MPRYLICVFPDGEGMRVREIPFEPIEKVLNRAVSLSRNNEHLWSIALLLDDYQTIWLTGFDYLQIPGNLRDLDGRSHMQDRYLVAKHQAGERPPLLPSGLRVVSFYNEYGLGLPLWQPIGGQIGRDGLPLSDDLLDALEKFQREFNQRGDRPGPPGWSTTVGELHTRLCEELAGIAEVRLDIRPLTPLPMSLYTRTWTSPA